MNFHVQPGLSLYWPIPDLADASKILKMGFPKMGVPLKFIHFNRMFPYKPSIFGYLHLWKPPNGSHISESQPIFFLTSEPCTHNPLPCFKMPENLGTLQEKHINPAFYLTGHKPQYMLYRHIIKPQLRLAPKCFSIFQLPDGNTSLKLV